MSRQFGGFRSSYESVLVSPTDPDGIPLLSTSNEFGASPMGLALLQQVRLGLPNATFNLLPPDPSLPIVELDNPLPYWQIQTTDNITATPLYDTTAQTWGIYINPGTAPSGDYITLKTRSWVSTDDNFALRQKASLVLSKVGSYAGTTQWNTTLTAVYYATDNTALSTAVIGTVYDNTTWTSISGTTTTGGSAISTTAAWAEFTIKLTATANITSSTGVTLKSLILASSSPLTSALVVTDTYTASGTWTRPTGVTSLIAVVGVGGGGGGLGGQTFSRNNSSNFTSGNAPSGGSSSWAIIKDLYVGDISTVTVGVGTAGVGGTATAFSKAAAGTAQQLETTTNGVGGAGGATTFGAYLTIPGGGGATSTNATTGKGTAGGAPTSSVYGLAYLGAVAGVGIGTAVGLAGSAATYSQLPYWQSFAVGGAGVAGTTTAGTPTANGTGGAGGTANIIGSGSAGGIANWNSTNNTWDVSPNAAAGGSGAGGGGGGAGARMTVAGTVVVTGGAAGTSSANSGVGGAGGGGAGVLAPNSTIYNASTITITSGAGASGGAGRLYVVYVG